MSELGQRIRQARQTRNVTAAQLAERIGVSANYISELERGVKKNPSMNVISGMAEVLGLPVDYFFGVSTERRLQQYIPRDLSSFVHETIVQPYGTASNRLEELNDMELMEAFVDYLRTMKQKRSDEQ